jgi:hypothetical protein
MPQNETSGFLLSGFFISGKGHREIKNKNAGWHKRRAL